MAQGLFEGLLSGASRVDVPNYNPIDIGQVQQQTISGNLAALPGAQQLASQTNTFNLDQLTKMWQTVLPKYNEMLSTASGNLLSELQGNLPSDVVGSIKRASAGKALAGGYGGGGMKSNLTARDLGLTSLDLSNRAIASTAAWLATLKGTSMPAQMSPATMMLTPEQRYAAQSTENFRQWKAQFQQAEAKAAPDPMMAAVGGFADNVFNLALGAGTMSLMGGGGIFGGGGGAGVSGDMGGGPMGEGNWWR